MVWEVPEKHKRSFIFLRRAKAGNKSGNRNTNYGTTWYSYEK